MSTIKLLECAEGQHLFIFLNEERPAVCFYCNATKRTADGFDCGECGEFVFITKEIAETKINHHGFIEYEHLECPNKNRGAFSFGVVSWYLEKYGVKSEIMHTGGGCATLYVGEPNSEGFYSVVCGAGQFDPQTPFNSVGFADDFFIGADDDERQGQGFYYKGERNPESIAKAIFDYYTDTNESAVSVVCSVCSEIVGCTCEAHHVCKGAEDETN